MSSRSKSTAQRLKLLQKGFVPLPAEGKRGVLGSWPTTQITDEVIRSWETDPRLESARETALRLDGLVVFDVDIDDPDLAAEIEKKLPKSPFIRVGKKPRLALFFRGAEPSIMGTGTWSDGSLNHEVEVKAGPRAMMTILGNHDSGADYRFTGSSLLNTSRDDLPEVTPEEVEASIKRCTAIFERRGLEQRSSGGHRDGKGYQQVCDLKRDMVFDCKDGQQRSVEQIEQELRNGVDEIRVCCAPVREGATNPTTGAFHITPSGRLQLTDFKTQTNHYIDVDDELARSFPQAVSASGQDVFEPSTRDGNAAPGLSGGDGTRRNAELITTAQLLERLGPTEWLVKCLVEKNSLIQFYGAPKTGKSFIAIDLALSVASGTAFQGLATKKGVVAFIAGEGHSGLARRVAVWAKENGVSVEDLPIVWSRRSQNIPDTVALTILEQEIAEVCSEHDMPLVLIVIDTLNRNFGGGDENSSQDMTKFVFSLDRLRQPHEATCLVVHHTGHHATDRGRGSSVFFGAVDASYKVERKTGDRIALVPEVMKDAETPPSMMFELRQVELDLSGEKATSAVLVEAGSDRDQKIREFFKAHPTLGGTKQTRERRKRLPLLLNALHRGGISSVNDLNRKVGKGATSTTQLDLKALRHEGLVEPDSVELTEAGREADELFNVEIALNRHLPDIGSCPSDTFKMSKNPGQNPGQQPPQGRSVKKSVAGRSETPSRARNKSSRSVKKSVKGRSRQ